MNADVAVYVAIAAGVGVPLVALLFRSGSDNRSSFASEARLLMEGQKEATERAERDRDYWRAGSPLIKQETERVEQRLNDHIEASERFHAQVYEDISEVGHEVDDLRRNVRDMFNKRQSESV